jgi:sortase (surface protein transpeptidase)
MTPMTGRSRLAVMAGASVLAGSACLGVAWRASTGRPHLIDATWARDPAGSSATAAGGSVWAVPTTSPGVSTSTSVSAPAETKVARPVTIEVPAVGLSAAVVPVGLTANGDMQVPGPTVAGWYQLGPAPGALGPAVLVGHVDSRSGPAVFYRLNELHPGDIVVVDRADGSRARFLISSITIVRKAAFPLDAVFAPTHGAVLRLITCTGPFDPIRHHYTESLIAWGTSIP